MEIIVNNIEKANAILAEYKGAKVEFSSYNRFHDKIELLIDFVDVDQIVFITFISCTSYNGDLCWLDSELKISKRKSELDDQWTITKMTDLKTGFYIECLGEFVLKKGTDKEFSNKFKFKDDDGVISDDEIDSIVK